MWFHVCPVAWLKMTNYVHVCPTFPAFLPFLRFGFSFEMGRQTLHQSSQAGCFSQFLKGTTIKQQFFETVRLFCLQSEDKPNNRYISKTFLTKSKVFVKKLWLFGLFSGDKGNYIDASMIKIIIETNQIDMDVCFFQK